mgnify:FL=1
MTDRRWPVRPVPGEAVPTPFGMSAYCVGDPAAHAPDRDALVVVHGPMRGASLSLTTSPVVIGRNPEASLSVDDDSMSGAHARVSPDAHGWVIEDLGSTNGTWVDDERLRGVVPLVAGTRIRVGQTLIEARR